MESMDNEEQIEEKERFLIEKMKRLKEMEQEIKKEEKAQKEREQKKKQILLRIAPSLWNDLANWAEEDFRSINGQIEFLLAESVKKHKK